MKKQIIFLLCCMLSGTAIIAQATTRTDTIKVYGNCEMCKSTIEYSLKEEEGVIFKNWDMDKLLLTVTYDTSKINIKKIGKLIADVGYDNEYATAKNKVYNKLRPCCKYRRPKKQHRKPASCGV